MIGKLKPVPDPDHPTFLVRVTARYEVEHTAVLSVNAPTEADARRAVEHYYDVIDWDYAEPPRERRWTRTVAAEVIQK